MIEGGGKMGMKKRRQDRGNKEKIFGMRQIATKELFPT